MSSENLNPRDASSESVAISMLQDRMLRDQKFGEHEEYFEESEEEKRCAMEPVPSHLDRYLNPEQMMALKTMEYFGWRLAFVRRKGMAVSVPVIMNLDSLAYAVIEHDGEINESPTINIRH